MTHSTARTTSLLATAVAGVVTSGAYGQAITKTDQPAYVVPSAPGVITIPIVSNGPANARTFTINGEMKSVDNELYPKLGGSTGETYRMAGIPDGMGAYDNGDGTFTVLMNHELGATSGTTRAHGARGAFVSEWRINKSDLTVVGGRDLIESVANVTGGAAPFGRFCSADLAAPTAYFNPTSGLGTQERIYLTGEEVGAEGRAFGTVVSTRTAHHLPRLGKFSWENAVASPTVQDKTVVIGLDDSTPGEVYVYVGNKTSTGTDVDKAGLTNGSLYGVRAQSLNTLTSAGLETAANTGVGKFDLVNFNDVTSSTGATLQANSTANNVTKFARPEDGAWDPARPNDFYWVNTGTGSAPTRLYRMRFDDVTNPTADTNSDGAPGTLDMLLDGTESYNGRTIRSLDNMTAVVGRDNKTRLLIQEDIGGNNDLSRIWLYDVDADSIMEVATHDATLFSPDTDPASGYQGSGLTNDEESSGIIPAWDILGDGWFLLDVQAHYSPGDAELVEGGQMLAIYIPQSVPEPAALSLLGLGALATLRRSRRA